MVCVMVCMLMVCDVFLFTYSIDEPSCNSLTLLFVSVLLAVVFFFLLCCSVGYTMICLPFSSRGLICFIQLLRSSLETG